MGHHVNLAETGRRAVPVIERADRDLAPDCRIEPGAAPPAAARRDLYVDEQAVDGSRADGQNTIAIRVAKLQSAMLLKGRQTPGPHQVLFELADPTHNVISRETVRFMIPDRTTAC